MWKHETVLVTLWVVMKHCHFSPQTYWHICCHISVNALPISMSRTFSNWYFNQYVQIKELKVQWKPVWILEIKTSSAYSEALYLVSAIFLWHFCLEFHDVLKIVYLLFWYYVYECITCMWSIVSVLYNAGEGEKILWNWS